MSQPTVPGAAAAMAADLLRIREFLDHVRLTAEHAGILSPDLEAFLARASELRARLHFELGQNLSKCRVGSQEGNLALAIDSFRNSLEVWTRQEAPKEWSEATLRLADAYRSRFVDERLQYLETAVRLYEDVLAAIDREGEAETWAQTTARVADAEFEILLLTKGEGIDRVLDLYRQALAEPILGSGTLEWALAMHGLGRVFLLRSDGERAQHLERAIEIYTLLVDSVHPDEMLFEWAEAQQILGLAYSRREMGDPDENLDHSIAAYSAVLKVDQPEARGDIAASLAFGYLKRRRGTPAENRERAIELLRLAVEWTTEADDLIDRLLVLAHSYSERKEGDPEENRSLIIAVCERALELLGPQPPADRARPFLGLRAMTYYRTREAGDRGENIDHAITAFESFLEIVAPGEEEGSVCCDLAVLYLAKPSDDRRSALQRAAAYAQTAVAAFGAPELATNLCRALHLLDTARDGLIAEYGKLVGDAAVEHPCGTECVVIQLAEACLERGGRELRRALQMFIRAAELHPREVNPLLWARAMSGLGRAWLRWAEGDRARSLTKAFLACSKALEIYSLEDTPGEWATASFHLANVYRQRSDGVEARNLEMAIFLYQRALEVGEEKGLRPLWIDAVGELIQCLLNRKAHRQENAEEAIQLARRALEVVRRPANPIAWAVLMNNLGLALSRLPDGSYLGEAIGCFHGALEVLNREISTWLSIAENLASAYQASGDEERRIALLEEIAYTHAERVPVRDQIKALLHLAEAFGARQGEGEKVIGICRRTFALWSTGQPPVSGDESEMAALRRDVAAIAAGSSGDLLEGALAALQRACAQREDFVTAACVAFQLLKTVAQRALPPRWNHILGRVASPVFTEAEEGQALGWLTSLNRGVEVIGGLPKIDFFLDNLNDLAQVCCNETELAVVLPALHSAIQMVETYRTAGLDLQLAYEKGDQAALARSLDAWTRLLSDPRRQFLSREAQGHLVLEAAIAFQASHLRTVDLKSLDRAIDLEMEAIELLPAGSQDSLRALNNLGGALFERYESTGSLDDLDGMIHYLEKLLEQAPQDWPGLTICRINLATGLLSRLEWHFDDKAGDRAIELLETAATDAEAPAYVFCALSNALRMRYRILKREEDLDRLMSAARHGFARSSPGPDSFFANLAALASAHACLYEARKDPEDLRQAVALRRNLLNRAPATSRFHAGSLKALAVSLQDLWRLERTAELEQEARQAYRAALEEGLTADTEVALKSAIQWIDWAFERGAWEEMMAAEQGFWAASDQVLRSQTDRMDKEAWLFLTQGRGALATFAAIRAGYLPEAVQSAERGQARLLAGTLNSLARDLESIACVAPGLAARYHEEVERIAALEGGMRSDVWMRVAPGFDPVREIRLARADLDTITAEIRRLPGFSDFHAAAGLADAKAALTAVEALVYLGATSAGGFALVVGPGEPQDNVTALRLDQVTNFWIDEIRESWSEAYGAGTRDIHRSWRDPTDELMHRLWEGIMRPLVRRLENLGIRKAVLVPLGKLSSLPLHAARTEWGGHPIYALDRLELSYAPSARFLAHAAVLAAKIGEGSRLLAIDDPHRGEKGQLEHTWAEVATLAHHFATASILRGGEASRAAVLKALPEADVLHVSSHGFMNPSAPLKSGLNLASQEILTVADILDCRLSGTRLAVLSACETGLIGKRLPDEVVGLPSAFLQAGFAGVVASLWQVPDFSTALLMAYFYESWRRAKVRPVTALIKAQIWLRDTTNAEKIEFFRDVLAREPGPGPHHFIEELARLAPEARSFVHALYWAGFFYTGF